MAQQRLRGEAAVGRAAAAGGAAEAAWGTPVGQAAAVRRRSRGERAAASGRRQTETREGAVPGESEHEGVTEGGSRANASTIGEGESAKNAEGQASASTLG